MRVEEFIQRLEQRGCKVKQSGSKQWNAQCPAHSDRAPSLSISEGSEGRILLNCKAGCSLADIVSAAGVEMRDMFSDDQPIPTRKEPTRFEIKDSAGQLVATLCRLDLGWKNKRFGWERNGQKGLGGLKLDELPLYRSQYIPRFEKNRPVFVTEGAKDCDALTELGIQALGTVTGASSAPSRQVLSSLKGCWVVLWPDHDGIGYDHMRTIATRLKDVASKISFLLPPALNEKDGAFDWVFKARKEGGNPAELKEVLEGEELQGAELPSWEETPTKTPESSSSTTKQKAAEQGPDLEHLAPLGSAVFTTASIDYARERELLSLSELPRADDGEGRPSYGWGDRFSDLIGGGLGPGDLVALGASSAGAGKTAFLMQLLDGLALRCSHLVESKREGPLTPVLLLSEMSPETLSQRRLAWLTGEKATTWRAGRTAEKRRSREEIDGLYNFARKLRAENGSLGRVLSWSRQINRSAVFDIGGKLISTVRALVEKWRHQLTERYEREVWPVVVFDPVQRFLRGDKNEIEAQNELTRQIDAAAEEDGWLCFVTSDTNKGSAKGEASGDAGEVGATLLRGSYALIHGADIACYLGKPEGATPSAQTVSLKFFKNRLGPSFEEIPFHWDKITGRFRELASDELKERDAEKAKKTTKPSDEKRAGLSRGKPLGSDEC